MVFDTDCDVDRRTVLQTTAKCATVPALTGLTSSAAAASTSISFYLYPNSSSMDEYVTEAADDFRNQFASQLSDIGVDLTVVTESDVPDSVDELMGDSHGTFEHYVKQHTDNDQGGSALHMWFNTEDTGDPNTPGGSLVDGNGDAFTDMSMDDYQYDGSLFRRNMYFHEALHALMEEGQYGFACGSHSQNDDEHTCGAVDKRTENFDGTTYTYLRVTPLASSYDDDPSELGDTCGTQPDSYPDDRSYVGQFSDCTVQTLQNFFDQNDL